MTTGVEAHTHEFMATAHDDQKFGFSLASGAADEAVRRVLALSQLEFAGLHSHIGSQIFDTGGFEVAAHRVLELAGRIHAEHGVHVAELDLGGGFGIAYVPEDDAPEVKTLAAGLRAIVASQCIVLGIPVPRLTIEPGRGIIGPSTVTLYEVGTIKDVDGIRTYVSVDGGMSDNVRTALYDASYTCVLASRSSAAPPMLSRVVGRHCESGDIVVQGTVTCRRTSRRATCSPSRRPGRTAGRSPRTTTTCRAPAWSRWPTGRRGRSSAARHWMTCCDWTSDELWRR